MALSFIVGIPNGRFFPFGLGIYTRLNGYVYLSIQSSLSQDVLFILSQPYLAILIDPCGEYIVRMLRTIPLPVMHFP